ncbi:hypothetical protein TKK_0011688 [Trichogramma kaykai]
MQNFSDDPVLRGLHFDGYNYGVKNKEKTRNKSLASSMSYPTVKKTIQRAKNSNGRKSGILKQYSSIKAFSDHLQQYPELLTYRDGFNELSITAHLVTSSSQSHHLIFYDRSLLAEFNEENDMFADATFKISPDVKGVTQVLTVMCKKYNTTVPCVWVLMSRKTTKAYSAIWAHLQEEFPSFRPFRVTCDFEKAFMKSVRIAFQTHVRGCYFHFTQAIVRKAKSKEYRLYVRKNATQNPKGQEIIKKLIILPLLPPDKIPEGFEIIKNLTKTKFADESKLQKKWSKYLNYYFDKEWMKTVKPKTFSVYNSVDRTNNYLESYHRTLNENIRTKPSTFLFIHSIIKIKENAKLDLARAREKQKTTDRRKLVSRLRDDTIHAAWLALHGNPPWSAQRFINE